MNYYNLLKNLFNELVSFKTYKKLGMPFGIIAFVALLPFVLATASLMIAMAVLVFSYGSLESSVKFLEIWLEEKRKSVKHATEAVLYAVCMPCIFFFTFILSMFTIVYYILWFNLQVVAYIASLGVTKWQPLITYTSYDENNDFSMRYNYNAAISVIVTLLVLFIGWLVTFIIGIADYEEDVLIAFAAIYGVYTLFAYIAVPVVFKKDKNGQSVAAPKENPVVTDEAFNDEIGDYIPEI